jgi:glucuronosyltransferase
VRSWLPQQDILAHKNVKVFVTHGGLFSLLEGLHYGTKMVGLPLATDQFANMGRAKVGGNLNFWREGLVKKIVIKI